MIPRYIYVFIKYLCYILLINFTIIEMREKIYVKSLMSVNWSITGHINRANVFNTQWKYYFPIVHTIKLVRGEFIAPAYPDDPGGWRSKLSNSLLRPRLLMSHKNKKKYKHKTVKFIMLCKKIKYIWKFTLGRLLCYTLYVYTTQ